MMVDPLRVIAASTRREILQHLPRHRTVRSLADALGVTRQAVQQHLEALVGAGLVTVSQRGSNNQPAQYKVDPGATMRLRRATEQILASSASHPSFATTALPSQSAAARLMMLAPVAGLSIELDGHGPWRLGRGSWSTVELPSDPFMSARHAEIFCDDHGWAVRDVGSTNGTLVNGGQVPAGATQRLMAGDALLAGCTLVRFLA